MIKTLQSDFNIPINHYIQVDFAGFQSNVTCAAPPPSESELFGAPDETPVEPPPTRWLGGVSWHTDRTTF